jgi:hypothetical protein
MDIICNHELRQVWIDGEWYNYAIVEDLNNSIRVCKFCCLREKCTTGFCSDVKRELNINDIQVFITSKVPNVDFENLELKHSLIDVREECGRLQERIKFLNQRIEKVKV